MSKMAVLVVILCGVLAAPALGQQPGYWKYDGTTVFVTPPDYRADPYGCWYAYFDGMNGAVNASPTSLKASGRTWGGAGVVQTVVGQNGMYAWSTVLGESNYHYVQQQGGGGPYIDCDVDVEVGADTWYYGYARNGGPSGVSNGASCMSGAGTQGGGGATGIGYRTGETQGEGSAQAGNGWVYGTASVTNYPPSGWDNVQAYPYANPQPGPDDTWYEGELYVVAEAHPPTFGGTPLGGYFTASSTVNGICAATGSITGFNGYPGVWADAYYDITGDSTITLYGDIRW